VRWADPQATAESLSGGNLQTLVAARELASTPAVMIACYPTMGLDVTATAQIYDALFDLARRGSAVLWISEDLGDLLRYSHRIAMMLGRRAPVRPQPAGLSETGLRWRPRPCPALHPRRAAVEVDAIFALNAPPGG
jgi:ABC-type uncharacterized transport system ATPase subunit